MPDRAASYLSSFFATGLFVKAKNDIIGVQFYVLIHPITFLLYFATGLFVKGKNDIISEQFYVLIHLIIYIPYTA